MASYKELENVTYGQIRKMKHTLGFERSRITGTKYRKMTPYRNYYFAGESDTKDLDDLCNINLMKNCGDGYYCVTYEGKEFINRVTGVKILEEDD